MTVRNATVETITIAEKDTPRLASDLVPPHDGRLEILLQGQQEVMSLILDGAALQDVLSRIVRVIESAFAPALCALSLVDRNDGRLKHQIAPNLPSELAAAFNVGRTDHSSNPAANSALSGERVIVSDFSTDPRWREQARNASARGLRCCWVVPIPDCGEGLSGIATLYYPEPRELDAGEERILSTLTLFIGFVIKAAHRGRALCAANERFSALASAIPGVVYQRVVKPDGEIRYTYISDGARDLFGASPEEILADPDALFKTHGPEYKAKFRERLLAASKALTIWDVEATLVTPNGRKKYTHAIARPTRQVDGSVLWTGVILDETRTREAILDSLSQGFLLYDPEDRLIMRNSYYLKLFPALLEIAVPGATYEEVAKGEAATAPSSLREKLDRRAGLRKRIEQHKGTHKVFERELGEDRWILVNEQRTGDGGTVVLYTDISELKRRENQIRHLAYHDALTGLPNRALFHHRVERALVRARRRGTTVVVMWIDADNFKNVNDSLGHSAGDSLLKCLSDRMRATIRETDTIARLGGDEFGIVLTNANAPDYATQLAWRLLTVAGQPMEFNGQQVVSGISIGIATSATDGDQAETLLKNADLALYRAKADGRGTFRFFEAEMDARAQARRALEIDLRNALAKQEFELYYQPQVNIETHEIVGLEALVRWRHPDRGLVLPSEFIPISEQTGLIIRLGEWVLRRACMDATNWPDSITVAVNVSPAQFRNHDFAQLVAQVLRDTGLAPNRLEVEITESLLIRDVDANLSALQELKALGVRISMDDFGTGYSSLANLRSFPFDKFKIDRSFVMELEQNADSTAIVRSVLGLGRSLGMATCAEGVETREQLVCLRTAGCTEVQGYYYCEPRSIADIAQLLCVHDSPPAYRLLPESKWAAASNSLNQPTSARSGGV
jgi:diguanylate cyclase (GGDEF)-like protein